MADSGPATTLDVERGVATTTLDRPDNRNALSAGTTFCAGADLEAGMAAFHEKRPAPWVPGA